MKFIYYLSVTISAAIFLLFMFGPYAGPSAISTILIDGFYSEDFINTTFKAPITGFVIALNHIIAVVFWGVIIFPLILPFLFKKKKVLRYKLACVCLIILMLIPFLPKIFRLL